MDCKAIQEQLSEYLDGRLSEGERREIAAHLDACPACREALERLQKVVNLVGELPFLTAPEGLHEKILRQNLKVVPGEERPFALPPRYSRWLPLMRGVAAAAVLVLFAYLGHELIDSGPVAPESAAPIGVEAPESDPKADTGEAASPTFEDADAAEDAIAKESLGKSLRETARRKLKAGSEPPEGEKEAKKSLQDKLDKPPSARAGRKYREDKGGEAREPAPAKDEEEKWKEEAEGEADRRAPANAGKGPGASRPAEKGRFAGKPSAPGATRKEPAPSPEFKKKGEAAPASKKAPERDGAPAFGGRGERRGGEGEETGEGMDRKQRADRAPGQAEGSKTRGLVGGKKKEVPVTLLVFTADPAKALARIEADISRLKGKKEKREEEIGQARRVLEEAAKKLESRDKEVAEGEEERKQEGAPSPGSGEGAPGAEDAPRAEGEAPAPGARPEGERAFGAEKEGKAHDRRKEDAESDDLGEDEEAGGADPEGGPAKAEDPKERLDRLRKGQAGLKKKEEVKVLFLTLSEYRELKKRMANRETRFREQPTNLYLGLVKRLQKKSEAGFAYGAPGERALIKVTLRFEAPPTPDGEREGAKAPGPAPAPRPAAGPGEGEKGEEKPEKKE